MKLDREKIFWRLLGVAVLALTLMGAATPFAQAGTSKHITIKVGGRVHLVRSGSVDLSTLPLLRSNGATAHQATHPLPVPLSPMTPAQQQAWAQAVKSGKVKYPQVTQRMSAPKVGATKRAHNPSPNFDACGYAILPCQAYGFAGLNSTQTGGYSSADPAIASNPSYVLEVVNAALVVYHFNGTVAYGPVAASSFFGSVLHSGYFQEHPQVFWDATRLHWIIVMEEIGLNGSDNIVSYFDVAVSKTQNVTLNPATQYYVYQFQTNVSLGGSAGNYCDAPTLGSDYWGIWISCNAYDTLSDAFVGNITEGLSKNGLYTDIFSGFYWTDLPAGDGTLSAFNVSPASEDGTPDAEFLITTDEGYAVSNDTAMTTCAFAYTRGLAVGIAPSLTCVYQNTLPVGYTEPNYASQPGSPQSIYPGYGPKQVLYKNGAIDFAMTTAVSSSQDGIFWAEVQPQLSALDPANPQNQTVQNTIMRQAGVISYFDGADAYMPTYFPSSEDDGVLVYNFSDSSNYPSILDIARRATDAPGVMGEGLAQIISIGSNTTNGSWSLYSSCSLDTNLTSRGLIWCGAEYVGADSWDTWIEGLRVE